MGKQMARLYTSALAAADNNMQIWMTIAKHIERASYAAESRQYEPELRTLQSAYWSHRSPEWQQSWVEVARHLLDVQEPAAMVTHMATVYNDTPEFKQMK